MDIDQPNLGFRDGDLNILKGKQKVLKIPLASVSASKVAAAKGAGNLVGTGSSYSGNAVEAASVVSGVMAFDSSGIFISFS